ncbi:hypothetical protein BH23GEM9_BH23GEM9_12440 [soil metagenome]
MSVSPDGSAKKPDHQRAARHILAGFERAVLPRMALALPTWVKPDHLTILGLIASTGIAVSYLMTSRDPAWLWLASAMLLLNWFGDSLDGTLARVRKAERPRYGYYLDHLTDAYSTAAIGLGLGLSPYMLLPVGLAIVIAYLMLSINVYLETEVFREFTFSYGILGPTEARLLLIVLNTAALLGAARPFSLLGTGATLFDIGGIAAAGIMLTLLLSRAFTNLRRLAAMEPPRA